MLRILFISNQVTFFGEWSVDAGSPRREFFRLLVHQAADTLLRGENVKFFSTNVPAIVVCSIVLSITKCSNIHFLTYLFIGFIRLLLLMWWIVPYNKVHVCTNTSAEFCIQ